MTNLVDFLQGFIQGEVDKGEGNRLEKIAGAGYIESGNAVPIVEEVNIAGKNASLWVSHLGYIVVNFGNDPLEQKYIICSKDGISNLQEVTKFKVGDTEFDPRQIDIGDVAPLKKLLDDGITNLATQIEARRESSPPPPARQRNLVEFLKGQLTPTAEGTPSVSAIRELEGWTHDAEHDRFVKDIANHELYLYPRGTNASGQPCFVIEKSDVNYTFVYRDQIALSEQIPSESQEAEDQYYNQLAIPKVLADQIAGELAGGIANARTKIPAPVKDPLTATGLYSEVTRDLQEFYINQEQESYGKLLTALDAYRAQEAAPQLQESDVGALRNACRDYYGELEQRLAVRDVSDTNETAQLLGRYLALYSVPNAAITPQDKTTNLLPKIDGLAAEVLEKWTQVNQEGADPKDPNLTAAKDSIVQIFHPLGNGINFSAEEEGQENITKLQALHQVIQKRAANIIQKKWRAWRVYNDSKKGQAEAEVDPSPLRSGSRYNVDSGTETIATPLSPSDASRSGSEQRLRRWLPKPPSRKVDTTSVNPNGERGDRATVGMETDLSGRGTDQTTVGMETDLSGRGTDQTTVGMETDLDIEVPVPKPRTSSSKPSVREVDPAEQAKREAAAIKIQAAYRGHRVKKQYKESKAADHRAKILTPGRDENKEVIAYAYVLMTLHRYDYNGKISSKEGLKYFINQAQKLLGVTPPVKGKFPFDCTQLPNDAMIAKAKNYILDQHNRGNKNLKDICKLRDKAQFDKVKEVGVSASELMGIYEEKDKSFNYYLEFAGIDFKDVKLDFDQDKLFYANFRGCNFDETSVIAGSKQFLGTAKFTNCSGDQRAFANGHEGVDVPDIVNAPTLENVLGSDKGGNIADAADRASGRQADGIFQESDVTRENLSEEFKALYEADKSKLYDFAAARIGDLNHDINATSKNKNVVSFMLAQDRMWEYDSRLAANLNDIYRKIVRLGKEVDDILIKDVATKVQQNIKGLIEDATTSPLREDILEAVQSVTDKLSKEQGDELSKLEENGVGDFNQIITDNIERFTQSAYENLGKLQKYEGIAGDIVRQDDSVRGLAESLQRAVREKIEIKKFVAREESILKSQNIEIDQTAQTQYQEAIAEQVTDQSRIEELLTSAQIGEEKLLAARAREEQRRSDPASFDQHSTAEDSLSSGLGTAMMGFEPIGQPRVERRGGLGSPDPQGSLLGRVRHDSAQLTGRGSEQDPTSLAESAQAERERRGYLTEEQNLLSSLGQLGDPRNVSQQARLIAARDAAIHSQPSTSPEVTGRLGKAASQLMGGETGRGYQGSDILG